MSSCNLLANPISVRIARRGYLETVYMGDRPECQVELMHHIGDDICGPLIVQGGSRTVRAPSLFIFGLCVNVRRRCLARQPALLMTLLPFHHAIKILA